MKLKSKILVSALFILSTLQLQAAELDFFVDAFNFRDQNGNPYLEIHVNVAGESVHFVKNANGKFQGVIDVTLILQDQDDEDKTEALRVELNSPEISDTSGTAKNLRIMDVRRIPIKDEGIYSLSGFLTDKNDPQERQFEFEKSVSLQNKTGTTFGMSDVLFIDSFKKSKSKKPYTRLGYDVPPRIENDVFEDVEKLHFYLELYNTSEVAASGKYFIHTYITQVNSDQKLEAYQNTFKKETQKIDFYHGEFDVTALPSQVYNLHIELYESGKMVANKSRRFYFVNSAISVDVSVDPEIYDKAFAYSEEELDGLLGPMKFIATNTEEDFIEALQSFEDKKNFFVGFWQKRKEKDSDLITKAFNQFKSKVDYANEHYRAYKNDGWLTDRGRVLIQYGAPDNIDYYVVEGREYPHEIWRYNRIGTQFNPVFVFYDPDGIVSDYPLLHSDVLGERNNPRWRLDLQQRVTQDSRIDAQGTKNEFGSGTGSNSDRNNR